MTYTIALLYSDTIASSEDQDHQRGRIKSSNEKQNKASDCQIKNSILNILKRNDAKPITIQLIFINELVSVREEALFPSTQNKTKEFRALSLSLSNTARVERFRKTFLSKQRSLSQ